MYFLFLLDSWHLCSLSLPNSCSTLLVTLIRGEQTISASNPQKDWREHFLWGCMPVRDRPYPLTLWALAYFIAICVCISWFLSEKWIVQNHSGSREIIGLKLLGNAWLCMKQWTFVCMEGLILLERAFFCLMSRMPKSQETCVWMILMFFSDELTPVNKYCQIQREACDFCILTTLSISSLDNQLRSPTPSVTKRFLFFLWIWGVWGNSLLRKTDNGLG